MGRILVKIDTSLIGRANRNNRSYAPLSDKRSDQNLPDINPVGFRPQLNSRGGWGGFWRNSLEDNLPDGGVLQFRKFRKKSV